MKMPKAMALLIAVACSSLSLHAQSSATYIVSQRALLFADSLINAFKHSRWEEYVAISYPGAVQYYGGKQGFREYVQRTRLLNNDLEENPEKIQLMQITNDDSQEWQCVIKKTRETFVDGKKAVVLSYMIGQSKDKGQNWTYFDVSYNSVENIAYIMPDVFAGLTVPDRQVIYETNFVRTP
ncbi:MAG: hypothetical protein ABI687_12070 [Flavitalea sp.]